MKRIGQWLLCGFLFWYVVGRHFLEVDPAGWPIIRFAWGCWGLWPLTWAWSAIRRRLQVR